MPQYYTLRQLFDSVITIDPNDILKEYPNLLEFQKTTYLRLANGGITENIEDLNEEEVKQYHKDINSVIYNPIILRLLSEYRTSVIRNSDLDDFKVQKYISEILQYVILYQNYIKAIHHKANMTLKLDKKWESDAQKVVNSIKDKFTDLYDDDLLPDSLFVGKNGEEHGILDKGIVEGGFEELSTEDALDVIGIVINADDLTTHKKR